MRIREEEIESFHKRNAHLEAEVAKIQEQQQPSGSSSAPVEVAPSSSSEERVEALEKMLSELRSELKKSESNHVSEIAAVKQEIEMIK